MTKQQEFLDGLFLRPDFNNTLGMFITIEDDEMVPHIYMGNFEGYDDEMVSEVVRMTYALMATAEDYGTEGEVN